MLLRFGFVSNATHLYEASPAKTLTFARYQKMNAQEQIEALHTVTKQNLNNTKRVIHYLIAHEIPLYRFSSSIVPLATHPEVLWDFVTPFDKDFKEIGKLVKAHNIRTSFHPNQFTLFTSPRQHITENSIRDMVYHFQMLEAMDLLDRSIINLHVGGAYGDKQKATQQFHENISLLDDKIKSRMTLENDDKTYTTLETLEICEAHNIPLLFDYHHYMANPTDDCALEEIMPRILHTWNHTGLKPKIHLSSPKNEKEYRSHAHLVDMEFVMPVLKILKAIGRDIDFMVEAKGKDEALLQLVKDVSTIRGAKQQTAGSILWK